VARCLMLRWNWGSGEVTADVSERHRIIMFVVPLSVTFVGECLQAFRITVVKKVLEVLMFR
jgi:hypothetical protein